MDALLITFSSLSFITNKLSPTILRHLNPTRQRPIHRHTVSIPAKRTIHF